ncbi:histidine--tRNA ligase [Natranaerofaba carboxydovora]|uniref:histidine--tRNA ligase n=1 Tax=Natranaerofaba carboxydovora TaxID=2742683 RepID=UPI001F1313D0|nr:histidine--tRNA ligase [Natranaerofaba carboxydovora]UMZ73015.1 Histidine--tRNA ligase [Natranaerofaba carboxydovora]
MKIKGVRDYLKDEGDIRDYLKEVIISNYKKYGFKPVETSILNSMEVLTSKYGGGDEIAKEIYSVKEQGERDLGLRFDLTVPLMKLLNQNKQLGKPFKRCEIGKVFRNGDVKKGRLREFTQCDADIVGTTDITAEVELIVMVLNIFNKLGLEDVELYYNNRKVLEGIILENGIDIEKAEDVILTIDKLEKMEEDSVLKELQGKGVELETGEKLIKDLKKLNKEELKEKYRSQLVQEGFDEIEKIKNLLEALGKIGKCKFSASLARGLNFYDGLIYEAFVKNSQIKSSIAAGGRYSIIGESKETAVGISIGLDVLAEVYKEKLFKKEKRNGYYIIPVGGYVAESFKLAERLRYDGEVVELEMVKRSIGKSFKACDNKKYRYAVVIGEDEVKNNYYTCKDLETGEETKEKFDYY